MVRNHADRFAFKADKANDYIFGKILLDFEKITLIRYFGDQLFNVIRNVRIFRNKRIKALNLAVMLVKERAARRARLVG